MRRFAIALFLSLTPLFLGAEDLEIKVSRFGIRSDGTTLNTTSIQAAIDYIHDHGGGTLVFNVGRFLTGGLKLKSNVTIRLQEGAIIVGSRNPYDYADVGYSGLICAEGQENVAITGWGVIEGGGRELVNNILTQVHSGLLEDRLGNDRPGRRPKLLSFSNCRKVRITGITLKNSPAWVQSYFQCDDVVIDGETVDSNTFWNNDGLDFTNCTNCKLLNSYISATDDAICFKSEGGGPEKICENIEVRNCVARSGANGIKFGSYSVGGYKNIRIINCKVYDTFRSAVNIASPDGGIVENILIDSLTAVHVGNGICLRLSARTNIERKGEVRDVTIQNSVIEVSKEKPDHGYMYEGPVEDNPRNVCPCEIMGLPDRIIENVTIRNVEIVHPGAGDRFYAYCGSTPSDLDAIPEYPEMYPDFSKFKELPAWGFFIRHARNLKFENVTVTAKEKDYRPSFVLVDVHDSSFKDVKVDEPRVGRKQQFVQHRTGNVIID